jgi:hypothetical protein
MTSAEGKATFSQVEMWLRCEIPRLLTYHRYSESNGGSAASSTFTRVESATRSSSSTGPACRAQLSRSYSTSFVLAQRSTCCCGSYGPIRCSQGNDLRMFSKLIWRLAYLPWSKQLLDSRRCPPRKLSISVTGQWFGLDSATSEASTGHITSFQASLQLST